MKSLSKIYLFSFKPFQAFTDEERLSRLLLRKSLSRLLLMKSLSRLLLI